MQHPLTEIYRRLNYRELLNRLQEVIYNFGVYISVTGDDVEHMLTRWIITQLDSDDGQDTMYTPLDPLFPYSNPDVVDEELRSFLLSRGATDEMVTDIHQFLVDNSRIMAIRTTNWAEDNKYPSVVHRYIDDDEVTLSLSTESLSDDDLADLYPDYDIDGILPLTEITIPLSLYRKLLSLLRRSERPGRNPRSSDDYHSIVFSLITRYNTLSDPIGGSVYQYTTPSDVLRLLRERLGVTHETFSSPISFVDIPSPSVGDGQESSEYSQGLVDDGRRVTDTDRRQSMISPDRSRVLDDSLRSVDNDYSGRVGDSQGSVNDSRIVVDEEGRGMVNNRQGSVNNSQRLVDGGQGLSGRDGRRVVGDSQGRSKNRRRVVDEEGRSDRVSRGWEDDSIDDGPGLFDDLIGEELAEELNPSGRSTLLDQRTTRRTQRSNPYANLRLRQSDRSRSSEVVDEVSPIQTYTSLFPDVDIHFGSIGDYRDIEDLFRRQEVGIYAYPPLIETTIDTFVDLIHTQLDGYRGPATVVVALPKAESISGYRRLLNSSHLRLAIDLPRSFHYWNTGLYSDTFTPSSHDTTLFILQNNRGAIKYPLPDGFDRMVRRSFISRR